MSDEQDKLKLSLEPPKLFGRKKKSADKAAASKPAKPAAASPAAPVEEPVTEPVVEGTAPADDELTAVIEDVQAAEEQPAEPEPVADEAAPVVEERAPAPVVEEPVEEAAVPPAAEKSAPADDELTTVIEDVQATEERPAEPQPEETAVLEPVEEEPVAPVSASERPAESRAGATSVAMEPAPLDEIEREDAEIAAMAQKRGPFLDLYPAAALTGLAVGAAMVVLTWLSLRGCEAVRGTASCGGGPGFLLLVAIFAITVLLGSALLKAFDVPDPGSSSFLAVGLVAVVALLFLIDFVDSWAMIIVIPLLSVGGYLASVWVTKTFVEPGETAT